MREKIFERFVRANGSGGSGVGLGLTICREIVRAHEGRIWTDGREGGGSVFSLEIPRSRAVLQPAGRQGITPQGEPE
jgi:signal transduction histidine kinase